MSHKYARTDKDLRNRFVDFIEKAKEFHGDFYDYSLVEYANARTNVNIICPVHGLFEQKPFVHLRSKCGECGRADAVLSRTYSLEQFIRSCHQVHGDLYDYSITKYVNNLTNVDIACSKHGVFAIRPSNHIAKAQGCPQCSNERMSERYMGEGNPMWRVDSVDYQQFRSKVYSHLNSRLPRIPGLERDHKFPVRAFWDHGILDLEIINHPYNIQYLTPEENNQKRGRYSKELFQLRFGKVELVAVDES